MLLVAAFAGTIALSYEILWVRAYSFVTGGTASSFGVLLGAYLFGLAIGSLLSWFYCNDRRALAGRERLATPAGLLVAASALGFLSVPALAALAVRGGSLVAWLGLVAVFAGVIGAVLPLVSHFGVTADGQAGAWLSYLYVANILGSAAGSLLTGFVLLDVLPMRRVATVLALAGLAVAALLLLAAGGSASALALRLGLLGLAGALALLADEPLFHHAFEKMQRKANYDPSESFTDLVENRSGVISVLKDGTIFGGGVYDGAYSVDLVHDKNLIVRPYALAAFHPHPRRVLLIGLSSGSWAQVLAHNPDVERLTVIDINPGYLGLIPRHAAVASLLANPKLEVVIDDGRRWLAAHPERQFDAVFSNTTWHWRSMATSLLSAEFLRLVGRHLADGGVFIWNTTFSLEAQKTGCEVFPYGFRFLNSMVASNQPISLDRARWREALLAYRIEGKAVFDLTNPAHVDRLEEVLRIGPTPGRPDDRNKDFQPCPNLLRWTRELRSITDDNMASEWYRPWWATP